MGTLISELRATIVRGVDKATRHELASIVSALCAHEDLGEFIRTAPELAAAAPRLEVVGETVRDHSSGLEWTRGLVPGGQMAWEAAKAACEKLELDGGGWRLPTIQELLTLVDYERHDPAIDTTIFTGCPSSWFWTSTPYAPSPGDCAWGVRFGYGDAYWNGRSLSGFVRAVRASQS